MKAVLVIDMPTTCEDCPCCIIHENSNAYVVSARCGAIYKGWIDERTFEKHELCPLKPLPQKGFGDADDIEQASYFDGWNECLDEIMGETE